VGCVRCTKASTIPATDPFLHPGRRAAARQPAGRWARHPPTRLGTSLVRGTETGPLNFPGLGGFWSAAGHKFTGLGGIGPGDRAPSWGCGGFGRCAGGPSRDFGSSGPETAHLPGDVVGSGVVPAHLPGIWRFGPAAQVNGSCDDIGFLESPNGRRIQVAGIGSQEGFQQATAPTGEESGSRPMGTSAVRVALLVKVTASDHATSEHPGLELWP
jgi:hypothetical protein